MIISMKGDPGYFGPQSMMWKINKEITVLFGGARALLMHAAHPLIAAGARQTSFYQRDPWKRLIRTLSLQNSVTFGTKKEADDSAYRINKLPEVIKGKDPISEGIYDALDHEQLLWVHACLQISSIYFYEKTVKKLTTEEKERLEEDAIGVATEKIRQVQRAELAQLERTVLLQIFDSVWKDHLYQMDQAKESIGFRSFSQLDPRIEYKREGARLFDEMFEHMQERVTDLVFKAKMQVRMQKPPQQEQQSQQPQGADRQPAPQQQQASPQRPAPKPAEQAIRAASSASNQGSKQAMTVGRNEPCPCGSGKKFKKCCGKK